MKIEFVPGIRQVNRQVGTPMENKCSLVNNSRSCYCVITQASHCNRKPFSYGLVLLFSVTNSVKQCQHGSSFYHSHPFLTYLFGGRKGLRLRFLALFKTVFRLFAVKMTVLRIPYPSTVCREIFTKYGPKSLLITKLKKATNNYQNATGFTFTNRFKVSGLAFGFC